MRTGISAIFTITLLTALSMPLLAGLCAASSSPGDTDADVQTFRVCREGLTRTLAYVKFRPDLFKPERKKRKALLTRGEKMEAWSAWSAMLDYTATMDSVGARNGVFMGQVSGKPKRTSFSLVYAAFLAEYRYALEFISMAKKNPELDTVLDEQVPEFGLPKGSYSRFKSRFLNVKRATEFTALLAVDKGLPGKDDASLRAAMREDSSVIRRMGRGKGPVMTFTNSVSIVKKLGFAAWFPVQKGASEVMGEVKVRHIGKSFISREQIRAFGPRLQPGDILLERHYWYLSNLGLPGFWTHAALYVGTEAERREFFNDPEVRGWVRGKGEMSGNFESLLRRRYSSAYGASSTSREDNHLPRILEAVSEGVTFNTLEHSAAADSLAVLRPRLSRREKAEALLRAFHYSGRPYDFNFDFRTDSELVCSELIYKVYEPAPGMTGVHFPVSKVMGRPVTTPNDIARQFSEQHGTSSRQTDLVLFLDGSEKTDSAVESDVSEFRRSWQRPKWHVLTHKSPDKQSGERIAVRPESMP